MLDKHLLVKIRPQANKKNIICWGNYRVTVLQDRLFRLEYNENKKFRDDATQSVWYRDMPEQPFNVTERKGKLIIDTSACILIIAKERKDCRVVLNEKYLKINNEKNLKGTYRTLDGRDGKLRPSRLEDGKLVLETGVCSRNGIAVFDDVNSLTLGLDGALKPMRGEGTDEYIFVYGDDYRSAVKALFLITGKAPMIPRFALGNWWSRYHVYTDKEYLRLLNAFEEQDVPLTVATIDMDWHYSDSNEIDALYSVTKSGRNTEEYIGKNMAWTGYSWNKRLFPDYKAFLKKIEDKNLKITLNLHPADGVRFWETQYEAMAKLLNFDTTEGKRIPFDIANEEFINAYFKVLHKPYEADGVSFWWIDWQQGTNSGMDGLDPLWALNHYHYLDNGVNHRFPLILSRYCGIGSHRYPLGFSGDTYVTWDTLNWLPEFTATSTNVGYTWWSHDIGGHYFGEKDDEMYLRHIQYGVFSPINRLHCCNAEIQTKEPWAYGNGAGELIKIWMRLRHRLIPYLYTAAYRTHTDGLALVEPLYYEWKQPQAYRYKNEYLFGDQLLVIPVTHKAKQDGFAHIKAWLPEGKWTDIFTGAKYHIPTGGKVFTMYREMESIPVLIKSGGILPLSLDNGNSVNNPQNMEILVYSGNGDFTLYEDGETDERSGEFFTHFKTKYEETNNLSKQTLVISTKGNSSIIPQKRVFKVRFKDITDGKIVLYANEEHIQTTEILTDCVALDFDVQPNKEYRIEVLYTPKTRLGELKAYACAVLTCARDKMSRKDTLWRAICKTVTIEEYVKLVDETDFASKTIKNRLKEII